MSVLAEIVKVVFCKVFCLQITLKTSYNAFIMFINRVIPELLNPSSSSSSSKDHLSLFKESHLRANV